MKLNGANPKPARPVDAGDEIRVRKGPYEFLVTVTLVSDKRGSAEDAKALYEESAESIEARAEVAARMKEEAARSERQSGRPSKRDRRELMKLKGRRK